MTARWYTIQLLQHLIETAGFNLKRQNFEPFFPRVEIRITRKTTRIEPMFQGYGFVRFDPNEPGIKWTSINGTRGVVGLLPRYAKTNPQPMPEGFVERLKENDPLQENDFLTMFEEYFPGITEVQVGPEHYWLAGQKGLVTNVRGRMLEISFDKAVRGMWLDRDQVSPVLKEE